MHAVVRLRVFMHAVVQLRVFMRVFFGCLLSMFISSSFSASSSSSSASSSPMPLSVSGGAAMVGLVACVNAHLAEYAKRLQEAIPHLSGITARLVEVRQLRYFSAT